MHRAESTRRRYLWGAATLLAGLALAGCSGPVGNQPHAGLGDGGTTGTLVLFAEDQPAGNVLAFELTISGATLTNSTGGTVSVLGGAVGLEWRSRGLAPTVLSITNVPPATYTQLTLTLSSPEMTVFDPLAGTFAEINSSTIPSATLSTSSVNLSINLTLGSGEVAGLRVDLDLRNSVQLDANNNFVINPLFAVVPTSFVVGQLPGDIDDVVGNVSALNVGGNQLTLTVLASNQATTVSVDTGTLFEVVSGLGGLAVGDALEVDARLQSSGDFLAQEIERETPGASQQLRGLVLGRTPTTGNLDSLTLLVLDAIPAAFNAGGIVTVTVDASTVFRISVEDLPVVAFPNFDFDRQTLRAGQFVHVVQRAGAGFVAGSITLEEIALVGQVGATVGTNSFEFLPDGDFFALNGLRPITVTTSTATGLQNMPFALGSLQPNQSIVAVRGVLLFQANNGVLVSKRVRLLQ